MPGAGDCSDAEISQKDCPIAIAGLPHLCLNPGADNQPQHDHVANSITQR